MFTYLKNQTHISILVIKVKGLNLFHKNRAFSKKLSSRLIFELLYKIFSPIYKKR